MSTKVLSTQNYESFKLLQGNRHISNSHVKNLAEAMRLNPHTNEVRPILVNENMEVIDGQHRLEACKILGLPVSYIKGKGLTIEDAQRLNATQRNWNPTDYAYSFMLSGDSNYADYLDFRAKYKLPHNTTMSFLTQDINSTAYTKAFKDGLFKVKSMDKACELADMLVDLGEVCKDYRRRYFGLTFLLMAKNPIYRQKHFKKALSKYGDKYLARYETITDYIRAMETIYNYNIPLKNQIMIRLDLADIQ